MQQQQQQQQRWMGLNDSPFFRPRHTHTSTRTETRITSHTHIRARGRKEQTGEIPYGWMNGLMDGSSMEEWNDWLNQQGKQGNEGEGGREGAQLWNVHPPTLQNLFAGSPAAGDPILVTP
eukprot:GHVU01132390.1.p1 GENE.GHVU01132390.1~~GHVU01132390.1.p1  ORF type:complete len:120 (+),score=28.49 GHVU01132390.1:178-537(+)